MTKSIFGFIVAVFFTVGFNGCAGSSSSLSNLSNSVNSKKARVIFNVPSSTSAEQVKKALYSSISTRVSDVKDNENFMPEQLPASPQSPKQNNRFGNLSALAGNSPQFAMLKLDTSNAYYTVQGVRSMKMTFNSRDEVYKGAIYPYQGGYKVYIYQFYQEGKSAIVGKLAEKALESVAGKQGFLPYMVEVRNKFKQLLPSATIVSQSPSQLNSL